MGKNGATARRRLLGDRRFIGQNEEERGRRGKATRVRWGKGGRQGSLKVRAPAEGARPLAMAMAECEGALTEGAPVVGARPLAMAMAECEGALAEGALCEGNGGSASTIDFGEGDGFWLRGV